MTGSDSLLSSLPFAPPPGNQPLLPANAKATEQFARLLDALLVLDAEGPCRVTDLAARVGVKPSRMRELLSTYMVAGAEALGPGAPFNLTFGTEAGPLSGDEEDDDAQAGADVVYLSGERGRAEWLIGDVGRRPVMVKDVARAVLAASLLAEDETLADGRRLEVVNLLHALSEAMGASVKAPAVAIADDLQRAAAARQRIRFRYRHPWTAESAVVEVEPYDVHRRRERLVLDAGSPLTSYDVGSISELSVISEPGAFDPVSLPPREDRVARVSVVLRVSTPAQEDWVCEGWRGKVVGPTGDGRIDIRIELDGDAEDPGASDRLGAFLLQLGDGASVVSPAELQGAARRVAERLLAVHEG